MIGDLARNAIAECRPKNPRQKRALCVFPPRLPELGHNPENDSAYHYTDGLYYVKYKPAIVQQFKNEPFFIKADFLPGGKVRFKNAKQLKAKLEKMCPDAANFLYNYTTYNNNLISIACEHIQMEIYFNIDYVKYTVAANGSKFKVKDENYRIGVFRLAEIEEIEKQRYKMWLNRNGVERKV